MRPGGYPAGHTGDPHQGGGLIGNMLGWNGNPIYEGFKKIPSEFLMTLGAGLMRGDPDWGMSEYAQMLPSIREEERHQQEMQRSIQMRDNYARVLRNMGPDFYEMADAVHMGAADPGQAWGEALKMKGALREQEEALRSARANAIFIKDPELRQMVEAGALSFKEAYQHDREGTKPISANIGPNGIDYGDPTAGLEWLRDENGQMQFDERNMPIAAPYQGSEQYQEMLDREAAMDAGPSRDQKQADIVVQDIDRALLQIAANPFMTTGPMAQATGWLGNTPANNVGELIKTVKANAGFDELQAMREASPTGGALGSITEREIAYLQATIGSLEQSQGAQQLADNLIRVKNAYLDIIHGPDAGPPPRPSGAARSGASPTRRMGNSGSMIRCLKMLRRPGLSALRPISQGCPWWGRWPARWAMTAG